MVLGTMLRGFILEKYNKIRINSYFADVLIPFETQLKCQISGNLPYLPPKCSYSPVYVPLGYKPPKNRAGKYNA